MARQKQQARGVFMGWIQLEWVPEEIKSRTGTIQLLINYLKINFENQKISAMINNNRQQL